MKSFPFHLDISIAENGKAVNGEQNVSNLEDAVTGTGAIDMGQHDTGVLRSKAHGTAMGAVQEREIPDTQVDIPVISAVFHIFHESIDHGYGNHETHILGHVPAVALKRHAHDRISLKHRPPAVSGIDCRIDLNSQVLIQHGMRIDLVIDTGHDTPRDGQPASPDRITQDSHHGIQRGHAANGQRNRIIEKGPVRHLQHGQVAIVGDEPHSGFILPGIPFLLNGNESGVTGYVGIGENPIVGNDKAGPRLPVHSARIPGHGIIRLLRNDRDFDDALSNSGNIVYGAHARRGQGKPCDR